MWSHKALGQVKNILVNKTEQFNFNKIRNKPVKFGENNVSMWIFKSNLNFLLTVIKWCL